MGCVEVLTIECEMHHRLWVWFCEKAKLSPERHSVMVLSLAALPGGGLLGGRGFLDPGLKTQALFVAG